MHYLGLCNIHCDLFFDNIQIAQADLNQPSDDINQSQSSVGKIEGTFVDQNEEFQRDCVNSPSYHSIQGSQRLIASFYKYLQASYNTLDIPNELSDKISDCLQKRTNYLSSQQTPQNTTFTLAYLKSNQPLASPLPHILQNESCLLQTTSANTFSTHDAINKQNSSTANFKQHKSNLSYLQRDKKIIQQFLSKQLADTRQKMIITMSEIYQVNMKKRILQKNKSLFKKNLSNSHPSNYSSSSHTLSPPGQYLSNLFEENKKKQLQFQMQQQELDYQTNRLLDEISSHENTLKQMQKLSDLIQQMTPAKINEGLNKSGDEKGNNEAQNEFEQKFYQQVNKRQLKSFIEYNHANPNESIVLETKLRT